MLKQLNIKREYILIAASIVMLLLAYQLAFKRTVEAWQLHSELKKQITQSSDLGYQPGYLERKNRNLGKVMLLYQADTINFRSNILSTISSIADQQKVKLTEVPLRDPIYHTSKFIIQKLSFEGDYFALETTLNKLQATSRIGMIISAILTSSGMHDGNNETKKVRMDVYIEIATGQ